MHVTRLAVAAAVVSAALGCAGEPDRTRPRAAPEVPENDLGESDTQLQEVLKRHPVHELGYLNRSSLRKGERAALQVRERNNSLWIQLYEASKDRGRSFCLKIVQYTDEGDPITTYYVARDGSVRKIVDCRKDSFSIGGLQEQQLSPFQIGYLGTDLPCPCGSGQTWLQCNPGACRTPTFVIVTGNYPKDRDLCWIPAPIENESSMTWVFDHELAREDGDE
jgi:hypothetical protein